MIRTVMVAQLAQDHHRPPLEMEPPMFASSMKRWARRSSIAASIVVAGTLVMGIASTPAKAQASPYGYYPSYNSYYYPQYYPYYYPPYPYGYAAPYGPAFNVNFGFGPRFFHPDF